MCCIIHFIESIYRICIAKTHHAYSINFRWLEEFNAASKIEKRLFLVAKFFFFSSSNRKISLASLRLGKFIENCNKYWPSSWASGEKRNSCARIWGRCSKCRFRIKPMFDKIIIVDPRADFHWDSLLWRMCVCVQRNSEWKHLMYLC